MEFWNTHFGLLCVMLGVNFSFSLECRSLWLMEFIRRVDYLRFLMSVKLQPVTRFLCSRAKEMLVKAVMVWTVRARLEVWVGWVVMMSQILCVWMSDSSLFSIVCNALCLRHTRKRAKVSKCVKVSECTACQPLKSPFTLSQCAVLAFREDQ